MVKTSHFRCKGHGLDSCTLHTAHCTLRPCTLLHCVRALHPAQRKVTVEAGGEREGGGAIKGQRIKRYKLLSVK